jgi:cytochrome P450
MMIRKDGDEHYRLRRLVTKVFTPRAIQLWRERAESVVDDLLADVADRGKFDVITDYALPLPVQIITEMLGMSHADIPQLRAWSHVLTRGLDPFVSAEEEQEIAGAGRAMFEYLEQVVEDKRANLGDDILSDLIRAEDDGDRLDAEEIQAQVMLLFVAGHETTVNLIGNGLVHLFRFPEQLDRLRADPTLDPNAIEEVLRFDSPAQLTRRVNREALVVQDVEIPAGSLVALSIASANHDPAKWGPTADVLDVARPGAAEHVSFGGGPHFCLGAALARLEAQLALPRLVRRFPRLEPAYSTPSWMRRMVLRGVETLPVSTG